ncbi:hypothetical protein E2C01_077505 [Portunus trituberculatus]|uniref:Uncharacterized protein n=1 Tax=Portunus trituberculatus TaxID=210409 RepID=A0A5B7IEM1_PORTR|nr:hypothetical protein [Portunus trituberculatus]
MMELCWLLTLWRSFKDSSAHFWHHSKNKQALMSHC